MKKRDHFIKEMLFSEHFKTSSKTLLGARKENVRNQLKGTQYVRMFSEFKRLERTNVVLEHFKSVKTRSTSLLDSFYKIIFNVLSDLTAEKQCSSVFFTLDPVQISKSRCTEKKTNRT